MENKEYQCLRCRSTLYSSIKCHVCGSLDIVRLPLPPTAVDELDLEERAQAWAKEEYGEIFLGGSAIVAINGYINGWNDHAKQCDADYTCNGCAKKLTSDQVAHENDQGDDYCKDCTSAIIDDLQIDAQTKQSKAVHVIEAEIVRQKELTEPYEKDCEHLYCSIVLTDLLTKLNK